MVVAGDEPHRLARRRPVGKPESIIAGSTSRRNISVPARLRLWPSSPICTICATIARDVDRVGGPHGVLQQRAEHVGHPVQPLDDLGPVGAVAQHLAEPLVERAPRLVAGRRRRAGRTPTSTARRRRPSARPRRGRGTAPSSRRRRPRAAAPPPPGSAASPSKSSAPISAPRIGPDARSQSTGGPACRNWPRLQPERLRRRAYVDQVRLRAEHRRQRLRVGAAAAAGRPSPPPAPPGRRRAAASRTADDVDGLPRPARRRTSRRRR